MHTEEFLYADHSPDRSGSFSGEMGAKLREASIPTRSVIPGWDASLPLAVPPVGKNKGFQINADVDVSGLPYVIYEVF